MNLSSIECVTIYWVLNSLSLAPAQDSVGSIAPLISTRFANSTDRNETLHILTPNEAEL